MRTNMSNSKNPVSIYIKGFIKSFNLYSKKHKPKKPTIVPYIIRIKTTFLNWNKIVRLTSFGMRNFRDLIHINPNTIYEKVSGPINLNSGYDINCSSVVPETASRPVKQKIT